MRLRAGPAAAALLGAMCLAAPARAQHVDGRASIALSGSYNQTFTDAPYPTPATEAGPAVSIAPSGILLIDTPLTSHTLTYAFSLALPFTKNIQLEGTPLTYSHRLSYAGRYTLTEATSMSLSGNFSYIPINTLTGSGDPTQTPIDSLPTGAAYTLSAGMSEGLNHQLSEDWSLSQVTSFTFGDPIDPTQIRPKTYAVQNGLTMSRRFTVDTLGLTANVGVNYFTAGQTTTGLVSPANTQITDSLALTWMHPWTDALSMNLSGGVTQVISPAAPTPTAVEPTGSLGLSYRFDVSVLSLQLAHQSSPNLATGSVSFNDTASLRFSLPIGLTGLSTSGSGGFTHSAPIAGTVTGAPVSPTNVIISDAELTYRAAFAPSFSTSLRAQLQRQVATDTPETAFTRLSVSLSLTYSYPSATAAQTVPMLPPAPGMTGLLPSDITGSDRPGFDLGAPPDEAPAPETAP